MAREAGKADKPSVTFFSLCKVYVQVKQELPWLSELPSNTVRYTVKHLSEAYKRSFHGAGRPVWKRKCKDTPRFTVPGNSKIKGQKICIPKLGWVKLTGQNPYACCKPKQATCKYEAGNWYVSILYEVPDTRPARPVKPINPVGLDRNVGQVALSTGDMYELPLLLLLDAKRSARGSKENPGKNVARKRGLHRAILRSGWGRLERYMSYKTYIEKIDPKYTSQRCHNCRVVRKANRKSQSVYHCQECGVEKNADINAALNIRDKWLDKNMAFGDGAAAGGGGSVGWPVKPENVYGEASQPAGVVWVRI